MRSPNERCERADGSALKPAVGGRQLGRWQTTNRDAWRPRCRLPSADWCLPASVRCRLPSLTARDAEMPRHRVDAIDPGPPLGHTARAMTTRSPLDLDHATMQRLGRQVADAVAGHLASLRDQRVLTNGLPAATRQRLTEPPDEAPVPFDHLLQTLQTDVFPFSAREPHPGFMAYVPGCPTFPAVLGDWLATGYNFFAGVWPIAEGPNAVELAVLEWFRQWTGMPAGTGGLLTNGGSGATLTAIIAARHAAVGDDASRLQRLTLYASDQAHSAALRAAWIAGVPRDQVRVLPSDVDYRLRASDLQRAIADDRAAGLIPLAV